jgi:hypothetical protein
MASNVQKNRHKPRSPFWRNRAICDIFNCPQGSINYFCLKWEIYTRLLYHRHGTTNAEIFLISFKAVHGFSFLEVCPPPYTTPYILTSTLRSTHTLKSRRKNGRHAVNHARSIQPSTRSLHNIGARHHVCASRPCQVEAQSK